MGLLNQSYHEEDLSYGYGPSFEEMARRKNAFHAWQQAWREEHLIPVQFGKYRISCSLYVERRDYPHKSEWPYDPQYDICSGHEDDGHGMLVNIDPSCLPEELRGGYTLSVSIECLLQFDEEKQAYIPNERFWKRIKKWIEYEAYRHPLLLDGETYYFPVKK